MSNVSRAAVLIIIGVTGDLSRRYLLPALEDIAAAHALPDRFHVIGTSRQPVSAKSILEDFSRPMEFLSRNLEVFQLDPADDNSYQALSDHLDELDTTLEAPVDRLFYLSIPPQVAWPVIEKLGMNGLSKRPGTKLLLEKPFGTDLASAETLLEHVERHFAEPDVFRIDHYLAKEMAQNLMVFRHANPIFHHTWNRDFIESIDITIAESLDIEGRAQFYEQTGALRDVVQSHGLQLAALLLMQLDGSDALEDIPSRRLDALRSLHVPSDVPIDASVRRAQYDGYRQEVDNPHSLVETYVDMTLLSSDSAWTGVPIRIRSGKSLPHKETVAHITYKGDGPTTSNVLTLRVQPEAGIELELWSKRPGYERRLEKQNLAFRYDIHTKLPDAYEQVLVDAIAGNHTLFTTSDEVRQSWRILQPIQEYWSLHNDDLTSYQKGNLPSKSTEDQAQHDAA